MDQRDINPVPQHQRRHHRDREHRGGGERDVRERNRDRDMREDGLGGTGRRGGRGRGRGRRDDHRDDNRRRIPEDNDYPNPTFMGPPPPPSMPSNANAIPVGGSSLATAAGETNGGGGGGGRRMKSGGFKPIPDNFNNSPPERFPPPVPPHVVPPDQPAPGKAAYVRGRRQSGENPGVGEDDGDRVFNIRGVGNGGVGESATEETGGGHSVGLSIKGRGKPPNGPNTFSGAADQSHQQPPPPLEPYLPPPTTSQQQTSQPQQQKRLGDMGPPPVPSSAAFKNLTSSVGGAGAGAGVGGAGGVSDTEKRFARQKRFSGGGGGNAGGSSGMKPPVGTGMEQQDRRDGDREDDDMDDRRRNGDADGGGGGGNDRYFGFDDDDLEDQKMFALSSGAGGDGGGKTMAVRGRGRGGRGRGGHWDRERDFRRGRDSMGRDSMGRDRERDRDRTIPRGPKRDNFYERYGPGGGEDLNDLPPPPSQPIRGGENEDDELPPTRHERERFGAPPGGAETNGFRGGMGRGRGRGRGFRNDRFGPGGARASSPPPPPSALDDRPHLVPSPSTTPSYQQPPPPQREQPPAPTPLSQFTTDNDVPVGSGSMLQQWVEEQKAVDEFEYAATELGERLEKESMASVPGWGGGGRGGKRGGRGDEDMDDIRSVATMMETSAAKMMAKRSTDASKKQKMKISELKGESPPSAEKEKGKGQEPPELNGRGRVDVDVEMDVDHDEEENENDDDEDEDEDVAREILGKTLEDDEDGRKLVRSPSRNPEPQMTPKTPTGSSQTEQRLESLKKVKGITVKRRDAASGETGNENGVGDANQEASGMTALQQAYPPSVSESHSASARKTHSSGRQASVTRRGASHALEGPKPSFVDPSKPPQPESPKHNTRHEHDDEAEREEARNVLSPIDDGNPFNRPIENTVSTAGKPRELDQEPASNRRSRAPESFHSSRSSLDELSEQRGRGDEGNHIKTHLRAIGEGARSNVGATMAMGENATMDTASSVSGGVHQPGAPFRPFGSLRREEYPTSAARDEDLPATTPRQLTNKSNTTDRRGPSPAHSSHTNTNHQQQTFSAPRRQSSATSSIADVRGGNPLFPFGTQEMSPRNATAGAAANHRRPSSLFSSASRGNDGGTNHQLPQNQSESPPHSAINGANDHLPDETLVREDGKGKKRGHEVAITGKEMQNDQGHSSLAPSNNKRRRLASSTLGAMEEYAQPVNGLDSSAKTDKKKRSKTQEPDDHSASLDSISARSLRDRSNKRSYRDFIDGDEDERAESQADDYIEDSDRKGKRKATTTGSTRARSVAPSRAKSANPAASNRSKKSRRASSPESLQHSTVSHSEGLTSQPVTAETTDIPGPGSYVREGRRTEIKFQAQKCLVPKYLPQGRCKNCITKATGTRCCFVGVRAFLHDEHDSIISSGLFPDSNDPDVIPIYPTSFNRPPEDDDIDTIKRTVAKSLAETIRRELQPWERTAEVQGTGSVGRRPKDLASRMTCDYCLTGILGGHWVCMLCGRTLCIDCEMELHDALPQSGIATALMSTVSGTPGPSRRSKLPPNLPKCAECHTGKIHAIRELKAFSSFTKAELDELLSATESIVGPVGRMPSTDRDPLAAMDDPVFNIVDCDLSINLPYHTINAKDLTNDNFQQLWQHGQTLVVQGVQYDQNLWTPEGLCRLYGDDPCMIQDCQNDKVQQSKVRKFFANFGNWGTQPQHITRLKDWPPTDDFKERFPDLYHDFADFVPVPDVTRRDGVLNVASYSPTNAIVPDLGPKMYMAHKSVNGSGGKGSTKLHMDIADAVNVMTYAKNRDGSDGTAAWDIFPAEAAPKLREFLFVIMARQASKTIEQIKATQDDPIHMQRIFLDEDMLKELSDEYEVKSWRIYQKVGEAVFIPAGCAHQVCNLADCIKVASDFVSMENIDRCAEVTSQFRQQTKGSKLWREDVLELKRMCWWAWQTCLHYQGLDSSASIPGSPSKGTQPPRPRARGRTKDDLRRKIAADLTALQAYLSVSEQAALQDLHRRMDPVREWHRDNIAFSKDSGSEKQQP